MVGGGHRSPHQSMHLSLLLSIKIMLLFHGYMSYCFEVSALRVKYDLRFSTDQGDFILGLGCA